MSWFETYSAKILMQRLLCTAMPRGQRLSHDVRHIIVRWYTNGMTPLEIASLLDPLVKLRAVQNILTVLKNLMWVLNLVCIPQSSLACM